MTTPTPHVSGTVDLVSRSLSSVWAAKVSLRTHGENEGGGAGDQSRPGLRRELLRHGTGVRFELGLLRRGTWRTTEEIFLASKTAIRSRDGSLKILDESSETAADRSSGSLAASRSAYPGPISKRSSERAALWKRLSRRGRKGGVRYLGLTGHHDPGDLAGRDEAIRV